jgi:putative ABC transport system permease protein
MFLETLWRDVAYGTRMLWQKPAHSAIAVFTLALGIGANSAIFSVVNAVLLEPLPFVEPDRLMALGQQTTQNPAALSQFSFPNFSDMRDLSRSFDRLAAYYNTNLTLTGDREAQLLRGTVVTADLFPLLGVSPALGRNFLAEEDAAGGGRGGRPVILSWEVWQEHFGGDAGIVGRVVELNDSGFTVVGVMPARFRFPVQAQPSQLWITTALDNERPKGPGAIMVARGYRGWRAVGRLKEGVAVEQAQSEAAVIAAGLAAQFPEANKDMGIGVRPLLESVVGNLRSTLLLLLGAVLFVLLIACVNVASLLLERAIARHREIKLRLALGASGSRIIRQLVTESMLLAGLGGVLGTILAFWGTDLIVALSPETLTRVGETRLDMRVLAFTALISAATGIAFGLVPALLTSKANLAESLKEGRRGATASVQANRARSALVIAEVALALVLLVGAGLLINSFVRLQQVAPGFDPQRVLAVNVAPSAGRTSSPQQIADFYRELVAQLKVLPSVVNASVVFQLPLAGSAATTSVAIEGRVDHPADRPSVVIHAAGPDYFQTMGIPVVKGRNFTERDDLDAAPVLIVNEALARQYFPNQDPIGKRLAPGFSTVPVHDDDNGMREIVGVVADVKHRSLQGAPQPEIYFAQSQMPMSAMTVVIRTAGEPRALQQAVRGVVQSLDRNVPVYGVRTLDEILDRSVESPRFNTLLLGLFAAVALLLTTVGLYGVISCSVSENTQQIGIRVALGAQRRDVFKMILGQGVLLTTAGVAIGLGAAYGLSRVMTSLLFGVGSTDPLTFTAVAALLLVVSGLACYLPARRAMNVDPMVALRHE